MEEADWWARGFWREVEEDIGVGLYGLIVWEMEED